MTFESRMSALQPAAAAVLMTVSFALQAHPQRPPLDTNGDGFVDLAEMQAVRPGITAERFGELDADGNGQLSPDELRALRQRREKKD